MREISVCLVGFGNVAKAFARLIQRKEEELKDQYNLSLRITAIATGRHGRAIDTDGIDIDQALKFSESGKSLDSLSKIKPPEDMREFIALSKADFLFENSPVNYETGEPAISHIRAALENDMHAVSANKGPVVHAYHELKELAKKHNHIYLFESAVMTALPFSRSSVKPCQPPTLSVSKAS